MVKSEANVRHYRTPIQFISFDTIQDNKRSPLRFDTRRKPHSWYNLQMHANYHELAHRVLEASRTGAQCEAYSAFLIPPTLGLSIDFGRKNELPSVQSYTGILRPYFRIFTASLVSEDSTRTSIPWSTSCGSNCSIQRSLPPSRRQPFPTIHPNPL